jgi:hypothetical protein
MECERKFIAAHVDARFKDYRDHQEHHQKIAVKQIIERMDEHHDHIKQQYTSSMTELFDAVTPEKRHSSRSSTFRSEESSKKEPFGYIVGHNYGAFHAAEGQTGPSKNYEHWQENLENLDDPQQPQLPEISFTGPNDSELQIREHFPMQEAASNSDAVSSAAWFEGEVCIVTASERCTSPHKGEIHRTFTEVCVTKLASPQRHNLSSPQRHMSSPQGHSFKSSHIPPGVGAKRIDSGALLPAVPVCFKEPFTFSESGLLDDVSLRAHAGHQSGSPRRGSPRRGHRNASSPFDRERCEPLDSASPQRLQTQESDTTAEDVLLDLSNVLDGVHGSLLGNSLDESMLGAGIDETFDGEPSSQRPQPTPSTIFFPAPPVNSTPLAFHAGDSQTTITSCLSS